MSISKVLFTAAVLCLATPVAAQVTVPNARTLTNEPIVMNPLCGARPRTPRGTVLTQIVVRDSNGYESCTWSTESYKDPETERQERRQRSANERVRIDAELQFCARAYMSQGYGAADSRLQCLGAGGYPSVGYSVQYRYGYPYSGGYYPQQRACLSVRRGDSPYWSCR
jgi:hypothetical protein|tara:strand:+ start:496552 stop:497055 length:504 start_codon:yes stop_codon:yes gene_type:complete